VVLLQGGVNLFQGGELRGGWINPWCPVSDMR